MSGLSGEMEKKTQTFSPDVTNANANGNDSGDFDNAAPPTYQQEEFQPLPQQIQNQQPEFSTEQPEFPELLTTMDQVAQWRNSNVDPNYCCSASARTWTLVFITLKMIGAAAGFCMYLALLISQYRARLEFYYSTSSRKYDGTNFSETMLRIMIGFMVVVFIFYCVSLYGALKENARILLFWIVLLCLELALLFIAFLGIFTGSGSGSGSVGRDAEFIIYFVYCAILDVFSLLCASAFWKRVKQRGSYSQIDSISVYSP